MKNEELKNKAKQASSKQQKAFNNEE